MGWGNPVLPETPQELPEYLRSLNAKVPFEDWVYEVVSVLQEAETCIVETKKVREYINCPHSLDASLLTQQ